MAIDQKSFETISITNDFVILVYPWKTPYLDADMEEGEPYILDLGPHFVSFSRSKSIGGTMQIESFGVDADVEIGDWVVLRTFSKQKISRSERKFLKDGRTKFIGQVYSKNTSHFADGEGNLRVSNQYTIREWSHVFHMQVKVDQTAIAINEDGSSQNATAREIEKLNLDTSSEKSLTEKLNEYIKAKYSPFSLTIQMLDFIGGLSANDDRSEVAGVSNLFKVTHRLPVVPEQLFKDIVQPRQDPNGNIDSFDKEEPWSTGFFWNFIGVQEWEKGAKSYKEVFKEPSILWNKLTLKTETRPVALTNPLEYALGFSFKESLENQFGGAGMYEFYTDLIYFDDSSKCAPALFIRDTPVSFRKLYQGREGEVDREFGWTYFDDIPRTDISPASVISITFNTKANNSANYMRYNFDGGPFQEHNARALATKYGVYVNIPSQKKFGTVEDERQIKAYITQRNLERQNPSDSESGVSLSTQDFENWFNTLSTKGGNYYPYRFLFPNVNVYLKDDDYPITVGMAVRIKLPNVTIVGFVESINNIFKLQDDGKKTNEIYLELSDTCMEDDDELLMPIPRKLISNLLRHKVTKQEKDEILQTWRFRSKQFAASGVNET